MTQFQYRHYNAVESEIYNSSLQKYIVLHSNVHEYIARAKVNQ